MVGVWHLKYPKCFGVLLVVGWLLINLPKDLCAGVATAVVDHTRVVVGEPVELLIRIEGDYQGGVPKIPPIKNASVVFQSQAINTQIVNGQKSNAQSYYYLLTPLKEGTIVVPSLRFKVDGQWEDTVPLKIIAQKNPSKDHRRLPRIFAVTKLSKNKVYLREPVGVHVQVFYDETVSNIGVSLPDLPQFRLVKLDDKANIHEENHNNKLYKVLTYDYVLIPLTLGIKNFTPFNVRYQYRRSQGASPPKQQGPRGIFDWWLGQSIHGHRYITRDYTLPMEKLEVVPLPQKGRPKDFSGVVGRVVASGVLSSDRVAVHEPVQLEISISGEADLSQVKDLKLSFDTSFRVYPEQTSWVETLNQDHLLDAKKTFRYVIVPTQAGEYPLQDIKIPVFVPDLGTYVNLETGLPTLYVSDAQEGSGYVPNNHQTSTHTHSDSVKDQIAQQDSSRDPVNQLKSTAKQWPLFLQGTDILNQDNWVPYKVFILLFLVIVCTLVLASILVIRWWHKVLNLSCVRQWRSQKQRQRLKKLLLSMNESGDPRDVHLLSQYFREIMRLSLGLDKKAYTYDEFVLLFEKQWPCRDLLIQKLKELTSILKKAEYSQEPLEDHDQTQLADHLRYVLNHWETEK